MKTGVIEHIVTQIPRYTLSALLSVAGVVKLLAVWGGTEKFLVPTPLLACVAAVEVAIGVGLLSTRLRWIVWVSVVLGLAMMLSTLYMVVLGLDIRRCGCLGGIQADALVHGAIALGIVMLGLMVDSERSRSEEVGGLAGS